MSYRSVFKILLIALPLVAAEAPKVTDAEKAKVLAALGKVKDMQLQMATLESAYRNLQSQLPTLQAAAQKAVDDLKAAHQCPTCQVNPDGELVIPENK